MMTTHRSRWIAGGLCLLLAMPATAATAAGAAPPIAAASQLTLEQIMADPDWIGNPPENPYWSDHGRSIYYERGREGAGKQRKDLYLVEGFPGGTRRAARVC